MERGFIRVGKFGGAEVRLHFFAIVAFVLLGFFSSRPLLGVAAFAILVVHELGHAALAWRAGFEVFAIELSVLQGACRYRGNLTPRAEAVVAWGGVLAQVVLLALSWGARELLHPGEGSFLGDVVEAWFVPNLVILGTNLLPLGGLDGAKAWTVFRPSSVKAVVRSTVMESRAASIERELAAIEAKRKTRSKYDIN